MKRMGTLLSYYFNIKFFIDINFIMLNTLIGGLFIIELIILYIIINQLSIKITKNIWIGNLIKLNTWKMTTLNYKQYSIWRPYFKKDGYFGLFFETTLWK